MQDASSSSLTTIEPEAELYLLHKARSKADQIDDEISQVTLQFTDLTAHPQNLRGQAVKISGSLETLRPRKLETPNEANLSEIWVGNIMDSQGRRVFFSLACYPLNLYITDLVEFSGYFLKIHADEATLQVGPLVVTNKLSLQAVPKFFEHESFLQKLVRDG